MSLLLLFAILTVDVGRCRLARAELQTAAEAAARYAVSGAYGSATPGATATSYVTASLAQAKVDGALLGTAATVTVGTWNDSTRTFVASGTNVNAVKVELAYTVGQAGRPKLIASAFPSAPIPQLSAVAISSMYLPHFEASARASGNLWLAGTPDNTTVTNNAANAAQYDNSGTVASPKQRPVAIDLDALGFKPGDTISFAGIDGTGAYKAGATFGPDGDVTRNVSVGDGSTPPVPTDAFNGIANTRAPIGSVIASFASDAAPTATAAPACLDFGSAAQRDYTQLSPQLKQVFYVGDGERSNGVRQTIVIPAGATRVFVGMMDAWQWNDNVGTFDVSVDGKPRIRTVR
jgi:Flp pilus assembly protein TadG